MSKKLTKKQIDVLDRIQKLISLDIHQHADAERSSRKFITIDTDELDDNALNNLERIGRQYDLFKIEPNGHKAIALMMENKMSFKKHYVQKLNEQIKFIGHSLEANVNGTSKKGTIKNSYDELVSIFGEPEVLSGDGFDNINYIWEVEVEYSDTDDDDREDFFVASIYDWNYNQGTPGSEIDEWNVGAKSTTDMWMLQDYIESKQAVKESDEDDFSDLKFAKTAEVGDRIRAWDFEPMEGRPDMYIDGEVIEKGFVKNMGAAAYTIKCDFDSSAEKRKDKNGRVGQTMFVPYEMSMMDFDTRVTKL